MSQIKGHESDIGWITSTSDYYYSDEGRVVTDTFRAGFYQDMSNWGAMFQLHKMSHLKNAPDFLVKSNLYALDYPDRPVKVHGIMSAVMLVSVESLQKIGKCEDWTNYTMLIDEDWSLEALRNNLHNVWYQMFTTNIHFAEVCVQQTTNGKKRHIEDSQRSGASMSVGMKMVCLLR